MPKREIFRAASATCASKHYLASDLIGSGSKAIKCQPPSENLPLMDWGKYASYVLSPFTKLKMY